MITVKEIKKLFTNKLFLLMMLLGMIYPVISVYRIRGQFASEGSKTFYRVNTADYSRIDYDELKSEAERRSELYFSGIRSKEAIDFYIFNNAAQNVEYLLSYEESMKEHIIHLEKEYILNKIEKGNDNIFAKQMQKQIEYYNRNRNLRLIDIQSYQNFLTFFHRYDVNTAISLTMLVLTVLVTVYIFQQDNLFGSRAIIFSAVKGRRTLFIARILMLLIFITTICFAEFIMEIIIAWKAFGVKEWGAAVQSMSMFSNMPFNISIAGYLVVCCLFRLFVLVFVAGVCLLANFMSRNPIRPLLIGVFINIAIPYYYMDRYLNNGLYGYEIVEKVDKIRIFCPFCLLVPEYYFTGFDNIVFLNMNMFRFILPIVVSVLVFIMGSALNMLMVGKKE